MEFRNDIQGLRAIAVLMVFIFHLSSTLLPGGFVGVDIFFVISGYLISSIIVHKLGKNKFSLLDFYYGRITRIVPAYLVMLILVGFIAAVVFIPSDVAVLRKSLFWSTLFNSNNHFATLDNYFGASSNENPILHTWTLAVEMQFYLFLPLLLIFIKNRKVLIFSLVIITIISLVYGTYGIMTNNKGVMYYSLLSRSSEFFVGVLATLLAIRDKTFVKKNSLILSLLGTVIVIASAFLIDESSAFPGVLAMIPCVGALLVLVSSNNTVNDVLANKYLVFIGEISYSVYLWHWPIMAFMRYYYEVYEFTLIQKGIVILLTIALSLLSYYLIEKSFRGLRGRNFWLPFAFVSAMIIILVGCVRVLNEKLVSLPEEFTMPIYGMDSHGSFFKKVQTFGDTTKAGPKILLIGDSHALSMKRYLDYVGKHNGFSYKTVTNGQYPLIPGLTEELIKEKPAFTRYSKLIKEVDRLIPNTDIIILQFSGNGKKWAPAISNLVKGLKPTQSLIVISDFAHLEKNPVRENRAIIKNKELNVDYGVNFQPVVPEIREILKSNPNCRFLDIADTKVFKDAPFYQDTLMYYDDDHLNIYGSRVYAEDTEQKFMECLNSIIKK
jgi:peptidoglycan/LPS O-acetylase OafA/YrhL